MEKSNSLKKVQFKLNMNLDCWLLEEKNEKKAQRFRPNLFRKNSSFNEKIQI